MLDVALAQLLATRWRNEPVRVPGIANLLDALVIVRAIGKHGPLRHQSGILIDSSAAGWP